MNLGILSALYFNGTPRFGDTGLKLAVAFKCRQYCRVNDLILESAYLEYNDFHDNDFHDNDFHGRWRVFV